MADEENYNPEKSLYRFLDDPTAENELRFCLEIKTARFLVPCKARKKASEEGFYMAVLITKEGERFIPAFSSDEELAKWSFGMEKIAVYSLDELKHITLEDPQRLTGIAINPFGKSLMLRQENLRQIDAATEGISIFKTEHDCNLNLLPAVNIPEGLIEKLYDFFSQSESVYKAYLASINDKESGEPHLLIVIDFDGAEASLFPSVAKELSRLMKQGDSFELMKATYGLLRRAEHKGCLVYERKPRDGND
jgi:hypothetical protein